jgi:cytoskeletal protein CcmA (bactofilin family)
MAPFLVGDRRFRLIEDKVFVDPVLFFMRESLAAAARGIGLTAWTGHAIISPMSKRRSGRPLLHATEISEYVKMDGTLTAEKSLLLKGSFTGSIHAASHVTIDREATVQSSTLAARDVTASGRFSGRIVAISSVEITDRASVSAEIESPRVAIAETAHFEGRITMPEFGD